MDIVIKNKKEMKFVAALAASTMALSVDKSAEHWMTSGQVDVGFTCKPDLDAAEKRLDAKLDAMLHALLP